MSNPKPNERAARFLEELRKIQNNRGKMASLRRGLSPSTVMDAWPVVAAIGGEIGLPGTSAFVDIAALYATHPLEQTARDFGESCRQIALADTSDRDIPDSHQRRFRRLLACSDAADLTGQLRTWIRLAASKGVGINYQRLFNDRWWWDRSADEIKVRWARSFWHTGNEVHTSKLPETPTA